jgi:xylulokinase
MSLLGIDVGTTGCKAAALSVDGRPLASGYREYAAAPRPDGRVELDARRVLDLVLEAIAEVAAQTSADPITALSISSMGEAMTPVAEDRQVLGPSILSSDTRGGDLLAPLVEKVGPDRFYAINPNIPGPNYSLPKLLWLRRHQAELYDRAWKFLLWGDLVTFVLGGDPLTSCSLANRTLLLDIRREDWSDELLAASAIDRARLPRVQPSGTVAGTVSAPMAGRLGLPRGTRIVVGGHDQCCNSLGAGIGEAGRAVCGIGTFECITPTFDRIPRGPEMRARGLNVEHHVLAGLYVSFIYNQAGSLVRWFRDTFAAADRKLLGPAEDIYEALAREMPAEPTHLVTLPTFEMTGPPEFIADPSGVIAGLRTGTTRGEILKSIMEGETFYFVESLQALRTMGIDTSEFIATGGGARSDRWLQIKADILGIPLVRPRITEASILGAAILAGCATGAFATPAEGIARFVHREKVFTPDPARHRAYQERYAKYRELYGLVKDFIRRL